MAFEKAHPGSDGEMMGWNDYQEMYETHDVIYDTWNNLFHLGSYNNCSKQDFFNLAKLFKPELEYDEFDRFIQYADNLFWGFIDKIPSKRTQEDLENAEVEFINFLIGWY